MREWVRVRFSVHWRAQSSHPCQLKQLCPAADGLCSREPRAAWFWQDPTPHLIAERLRAEGNMSYAIDTLPDLGVSDFKECLKHLRERQPAEALRHVQRALETAPENPFYLSYSGLLLALTERRFSEGELLCAEAVGMLPQHPQLYLNLAEVYRGAGRRRETVELLERALRSAGRDFRIRRARASIGLRRKPVFSFLGRGHPLNRIAGRWRHRVMGPLQES